MRTFSRLVFLGLGIWSLVVLHPYRNDFYGAIGIILIAMFTVGDFIQLLIELKRPKSIRTEKPKTNHRERLYGNTYKGM